MINATKIIQHQ